jgi:hypothetical protein
MEPIIIAPHVPVDGIHRAIAIVGARQQGKSFMLLNHALRAAAEQAGHAARAARKMIVIHDEWFNAHPFIDRAAPPRDRSHFERGGRYRKPPEGKRELAPEPGMVQVRNRRGELEWKKLGAGMRSAGQ